MRVSQSVSQSVGKGSDSVVSFKEVHEAEIEWRDLGLRDLNIIRKEVST